MSRQSSKDDPSMAPCAKPKIANVHQREILSSMKNQIEGRKKKLHAAQAPKRRIVTIRRPKNASIAWSKLTWMRRMHSAVG
mmetsp:Transcript_32327/g.78674  ORF Transcript_32327/g.78674 Transcript_32327/m.78674 type:complete len:81 (+) Transcript_32327:830-1072(+)